MRVRDATLLVLAGGQSRRMGRPKALLEIGGTTLIERVIERLAPVFAEVIVSANDAALVPRGLRAVADLHAGAGPLAGLEAGLAAASHPALFAVACDMPFVTAEAAELILDRLPGHDAAVPRHESRLEPTCAAYAVTAAPAVAAALGRGERRASSVLEELDVAWVDGLGSGLFRNLNTPGEYAAVLDALR